VPKFSIAIPVYNRSEYLRQSIASCLAQTVDDLEVIVSDDCSTENLLAIVQSFDDRRIAYHRSERRLGAAANHQMAVSLSNGSYVLNLHSDDLLLPNCLEIAGNELDLRSEAAAIYFAATYLQGNQVCGGSSVPAIGFADRTSINQHTWLHRFPGAAPSCCLFRRHAFDEIGGYNSAMRFAYDWELYTRFLTLGGGVIFLPRVLCIYRQHPGQSVQTSSIDGLWDMLDLWPKQDNSHWSARVMMGLVLTQCGVKMRSSERISGVMEIYRELGRRGVIRRLLKALPAAVWDKIRTRVGFRMKKPVGDYTLPIAIDDAVEQAKMTVRSIAGEPGL
jgi:glycosyltransferase involved in cell wall biosynthesis